MHLLLVVMDLLYLALLLGIGSVGFAVFIEVHAWGETWLLPLRFALIVAGLLAGHVAMLAIVAVLVRLLPRLRPGTHEMGEGMSIVWSLHYLLRRVVLPVSLQPLVFSSNIWRYLALRALGCKLPFATSMSSDVLMLDPSLVTIGKNVVIGARAALASHYFLGKKLVLAPIVLEDGVLVGADVGIAPGVRVGTGSLLRPRATLCPNSTIGRRADIGIDAFIGIGATLNDGEKVADRAERLAQSG